MTFRTISRLSVAALAASILACEEEQLASPIPAAQVEEFQAALTGANEVPAVTIGATATARFAVVLDSFLLYRITATGLDSPLTAHLHPAAAGAEREQDTLLVMLVATAAMRRAGLSGQLADAQLRPSQLTRLPAGYGATARARFDSLVALMRAGNVYVHFHTRLNTAGEIRGQIQPAP